MKSRKQAKPPYDAASERRHAETGHGDTLENAIARIAIERSRAERSLQILTARVIEAQEEERRRIARELHDGLNQQLAMFAVELGLLARMAPAGAKSLMDSILNLRQRAESLSEDLRHISHELHPAVLEHLGLHPALRSLCAEHTNHSGVHVRFSVDLEAKRVPRDVAICLYRVTQEALRNIAKHSGAKEAWVRIRHHQDSIELIIIDNGTGFNCNSAVSAGLGLVSMEERVQIVRGHFHIQSAPADGTVIRIKVPVSWKEQ